MKSLEEARDASRSIDGLKLGDLSAAASYTEATAWQMEALNALGREAEASRIGEEAARVAGQILDKRPAHMGALRARGLINSNLAQIQSDKLRYREALALTDAATQDWESFLKLDPGNAIAWNNQAANLMGSGGLLIGLGRLGEAHAKFLAAAAVERRTKASAFLAVNLMFPWGRLAGLDADMGNRPEAAGGPCADRPPRGARGDRAAPARTAERSNLDDARGDLQDGGSRGRGRLPGGARDGRARPSPAPKVAPPKGGREECVWHRNSLYLYRAMADAQYNLKEYAEAEQSMRKALAHRQFQPARAMDQRREAAQEQVGLAMILAREGRLVDARKAIDPALEFHRGLARPRRRRPDPAFRAGPGALRRGPRLSGQEPRAARRGRREHRQPAAPHEPPQERRPRARVDRGGAEAALGGAGRGDRDLP